MLIVFKAVYTHLKGSFLLFQSGKYGVVIKNLLRQLLLPLNKFVFRNDVVVYELFDLNIPILIQVAFAENFVHYLAAVVFVDAFLGQKHHHLVFVNVPVTVKVDGAELVV